MKMWVSMLRSGMSVRLQSPTWCCEQLSPALSRLQVLQRCALSSRGSQWPCEAWLPPLHSPQWQELSYLLQSLGQLLLQVLFSLLFLQTLQNQKPNGRFPGREGNKQQNPATSRADQLAWASGSNRGQEAGGKFPILLKLLAARDLRRVNCLNTARLRAVTCKPPLRLFWRKYSGLISHKCGDSPKDVNWKVLSCQLSKHHPQAGTHRFLPLILGTSVSHTESLPLPALNTSSSLAWT